MISVIIPAHNEEANLKVLLPRLFELAHGHEVEVLVSLSKNNKDQSNSLHTNSFTTFIHCREDGRALQMNTAVKQAKGKILVFLHADVRPPNGFFEDIKITIDEGYQAGFFSYQFDKSNFFLKINSSFTKKDGIFTGGGDQCLFIEQKVFDKLKGFDETQVIMEDFEFFRRMKSRKVSYKIVTNDLLVSSRKYENNSYARVNMTNLLLVALFKFGYPSEKLKKIHGRLLRLPYQTKNCHN